MSLSHRPLVLLAALLLVLIAGPGAARANPLDAISDRDTLEALALYPEDVRGSALEASTQAATLVELDKLQRDSQDAFRTLLDPYDQDAQQQLFDLSRYPDLVAEIGTGGPKSRSELEAIASRYPETIREAAVRQGTEHRAVVARMHALLADFDGRFNGLVADLPPAKQEAFRSLLATPELLSLLTGHMQTTVLLGDAYDRDPGGVRAGLADLNLEVARRNAEEAKDWQKSVDSDPQLKSDYQQAARDYQQQTGYSAYQAPTTTVVNVNVNPYPYWFGYPWWYPVTYSYYDPWYWWYPRSVWGGCGYSFGPRVVVWGGPVWRPWFPTFGFTSWYFSYGVHHARYPYLTDRFVSYYDRPVVVDKHVHVDIHKTVVKKFVYDTNVVLPAHHLGAGDRKVRIARYREYGKLAPEIEQARLKVRKQDLARAKGHHVAADFARQERHSEDLAVRDAVRRHVEKNPQDFPELAKTDKKAWSHGEREGGAGGGGGKNGKSGAKQGGAAAAPSLKAPTPTSGGHGGGTSGKGGGSGGGHRAATPSFEPPAGTSGSGGKGGGAKAHSGDKAPSDKTSSRKATPSFEAPSGGGAKKSGGHGGERSGEARSGSQGSPGASKSGGSGGGKKSSHAAPSYSAPPAPRSEAPRTYQAPPSQPSSRPSESSQHGGGGGGGGGKSKSKSKSADDADQSGGGGGGGGGGGHKKHH
jgi:hypothetical protein